MLRYYDMLNSSENCIYISYYLHSILSKPEACTNTSSLRYWRNYWIIENVWIISMLTVLLFRVSYSKDVFSSDFSSGLEGIIYGRLSSLYCCKCKMSVTPPYYCLATTDTSSVLLRSDGYSLAPSYDVYFFYYCIDLWRYCHYF